MSAQPAIVVGVAEVVDGGSVAALELAAREANRRRLPVKVVHGCAPQHQLAPVSESTQASRIARGRRIVDAAARRISKLTDPGIRLFVTNSVRDGVGLLTDESQTAALIVVQRRELGRVKRASSGSVTSSIAARSHCPVIVVRDEHRRHHGSRLLVGVDGTGRSAHALSAAAALASNRAMPLMVAHAWDESPSGAPDFGYWPPTGEAGPSARASAHRVLAEATAGLAAKYPDLEVQHHLVRGAPDVVLRELGHDADMVVVGRHSQTGFGFFALGPVVRSLINTAPCPVLITAAAVPPSRSPNLSRARTSGHHDPM